MFLSKVMSQNGKKGGAARVKSTTKEQRQAWGKLGMAKRWGPKK